MRQSNHLNRLLAVAIAAAGLVGQSGCTAMLLGGGGGGSAGQTAGQVGIAAAVSAKINGDPTLAGQLISVSAQGALVTLRGRVENPAQRGAAEALARTVNGVIDVDNRLVIQGGS